MKKLTYIAAPHAGAPDFTTLGFLRLQVLGNWYFFANEGQDNKHVDIDIVRAHADRLGETLDLNVPLCIDIETLPGQVTSIDRPLRDHAHDQMIEVAKVYQRHPKHSHRTIGFYGVMPARDFWNAAECAKDESSTKCQRWLEINDSFRRNLDDLTLGDQRGLASYVDRLYPSLYYWYDSVEAFISYADWNLKEAAKYCKPCIPFVSPFRAGVSTQGEFPKQDWQRMLDYVWNHPDVDGVYIWAYVPHGTNWDENADWWTVTKQVLGIKD